MYDDVEARIKRKNKVLFSYDSECLGGLLELSRLQNRRVLVLWAFECVKIPLELVEEAFPDETRPRIAYEQCRLWAAGEIKMSQAKRAILDCHAVCREIDDAYYTALIHAVGQAVSTVHVGSHAMGLPFYELTALVQKNRDNYREIIDRKINYYIERMLYYQENEKNIAVKWADFLQRQP